MGVGRAGIWDNEQPRSPDADRLLAQLRLRQCRIVAAEEGAIAHHAVEAGNAWLKRFKFHHQVASTGSILHGTKFVRAGGGAFHHVGEANPMLEQDGIVQGLQPIDAKRATCRFAENGARESWPESIRLSCEIMSLGY